MDSLWTLGGAESSIVLKVDSYEGLVRSLGLVNAETEQSS
jgi:hypothetical protein